MSSIFLSSKQQELQVPHDPDHTVTIRPLNRRMLARCAFLAQASALSDARELFGGLKGIRELQEMLADMRDEDPVTASAAKPSAPDPLLQYDTVALIERGVIKWSYDRPLVGESFEALDERTTTWLATEILKLTKPSLFQTEAEVGSN